MIRELDGQTVESTDEILAMNELKFFDKNPRVYSVLRTRIGGGEPTQEEIFELMSEQEHVKTLKKDIERAGLREAVIVNINTMEVIEGNSRLAAYRLLYDENPMKWSEISCEILPENITTGQIEDLISSIHMTGKKKWDPAEEAAWVWRLSHDENKTLEQLIKRFGWTAEKIKTYISTYQFMIDNNLTDHSQFSHWLSLKTNKHVKKIKKIHPNFEKVIIEKVQSNEINKAVMIRDDLPVIANAPKKLVKKFVEGELTFKKALKFAKELGVDKHLYKRLHEFNEWLFHHKDSILKTKGNELAQVNFNLKKIKIQIDKILDKS